MLYIEYAEYRKKYGESQRVYDDILREKEKLFTATQPKSAKLSNVQINGGCKQNIFDEYLIAKEKKKIDQRLEEIKTIVQERARLLRLKEIELRRSKNIWDRIYTMRYLDNLHTRKIALILNYSEIQIYRKIALIKSNIS